MAAGLVPAQSTPPEAAVVMRRSLSRAMESGAVVFLWIVFWLCLVLPAVEPLDQNGPADYSDQLGRVLEVVTICAVWILLGVFAPAFRVAAGDSPYLTANVTITTERTGIDASAVSRANQTYLDDLDQHRNPSLARLTGLGDAAFTDTSGADDVAEARVANILVVVHLTRRSGQTDPGAAEEILRHLVPQISVA